MTTLSTTLTDWLKQHSASLDQSAEFADELLNQLAQEGIFKQGVPTSLGGAGGTIQDAIEKVTEVAKLSLTAAFISWGHRTLIETLLSSENSTPKTLWLADLLHGKLSAGTGLSNAVKFLAGVEELQVNIREDNGKLYLNGRLPWVTNLRRNNFLTVFAASYADNSKPPIIVVIPHSAQGITRTDDLQLVALQGSNTAAVIFENVELNPDWILSYNAAAFLAQVRPAFLGLQCAMAFGLAKRSLAEVEKSLNASRTVLQPEWEKQSQELQRIEQAVFAGLSQPGYFVEKPKELFKLRIEIVDVVAQSVLLELQAGGGRGYLQNGGTDFIRRWREAAFLPVVTPSAVQLKLVLAG